MTRVVVAMSGGVDSSVAAALMKQQGHEVIGVTMTLAPNEESSAHKGRGCCSVWDVTDAEKVAWKLDIPHYTFNLRDAFEKHVISDFISEKLVWDDCDLGDSTKEIDFRKDGVCYQQNCNSVTPPS